MTSTSATLGEAGKLGRSGVASSQLIADPGIAAATAGVTTQNEIGGCTVPAAVMWPSTNLSAIPEVLLMTSLQLLLQPAAAAGAVVAGARPVSSV